MVYTPPLTPQVPSLLIPSVTVLYSVHEGGFLEVLDKDVEQFLILSGYHANRRMVVMESYQSSPKYVQSCQQLLNLANNQITIITRIISSSHNSSVTEIYQSSLQYVQSRRQLLNLANNRLTIVTRIISSSHNSSYQSIVDLFHFRRSSTNHMG